MCLDDKRQRWGKQNCILYVPASLLKKKKKKSNNVLSQYIFYIFSPHKGCTSSGKRPKRLLNDLNPAKDGVIRKMSRCDLVATVCLSQQRFSTFVLISGQCQESAPFLWFLQGMPLCAAPLAAAGWGWWTRKLCSCYMKDFFFISLHRIFDTIKWIHVLLYFATLSLSFKK